VAFIIGRNITYDNESSVYSYRLFSRGYLQSTNALFDTQRLIERYARTRTFGDLEQAYIRAQSGKGLFQAFLNEYKSSIEVEEDFTFQNSILTNFSKIIVQLEELLDLLEEGQTIPMVKLTEILERIDQLNRSVLAEEAKAWFDRALSFDSVQKGAQHNRNILVGLCLILTITMGILGYFIFRRRKLEKEIETNRVRLMNSHRMLALGEFSASVAHEVNNPLSIILWRLNIISKEMALLDPESKVMKNLESIKLQSQRIDKIIKGIKLLSQNSNNLDNEYFCLNKVLEQLGDVICNKTDLYNINLRIDPMNIPVVMFGKPVQLIQVFTNLLNNSIDAIQDLDERWIHIEPFAENGMVEIKITDSGKGISKSEQKEIFNLFYSSKKTEGTGIGLGLSAQMVKSFGGNLNYNHRSGNTQFVLKLPYSEFHLPKFFEQEAEREKNGHKSSLSV
jgi:signal transduction histidine kinase